MTASDDRPVYIQGSWRNDSLTGGSGNDTIYSGHGSDTVHGGDGDDIIDDISGFIYNGSNEFHGEGGNDTIWSGNDGDTVTGDDGNDLLHGEGGNDLIDGGADQDTIYGGSGNDTIDGGAGNDLLYGESGRDQINGGAGSDIIYAGSDDDTVHGGDGEDLIYAESGDDYVDGGAGNDMIFGGSGDDTFGISDGSGADTIFDFDMGDDDRDGFTNDQLDVSHLHDENGESVYTWDVRVGGDSHGNALLTFPNGETMLLKGVSPEAVSCEGKLFAMGVPCFVKGTLIETPDGAVPVERIAAGDRIVCADGAVLPVLWAGGRVLDEAELRARPQLRPVEIRFGSLGNRRDLRLSPQHAVAVHTPDGAKLARAMHLAQRGCGRFRVAQGVKSVSYHHLLLPRHALMLAEGAVVESMWPGPMALAALGPAALREIASVAPGLQAALEGGMPVENLYGPRAAPLLSGREVKAMARIGTPQTRRLQPAA